MAQGLRHAVPIALAAALMAGCPVGGALPPEPSPSKKVSKPAPKKSASPDPIRDLIGTDPLQPTPAPSGVSPTGEPQPTPPPGSPSPTETGDPAATPSPSHQATAAPSPAASGEPNPQPSATPTVAPTVLPTLRPSVGAYVATTLAGASPGLVDGDGAAARFNSPNGIDADGEGNVFVADADNHRIRKVTPAGVVSTIAGSQQGRADGTALSARFASPYGVAVAPDGTVFVADTGNHCIRAILNGSVTTLAGDGTPGLAEGKGSAARFKSPFSVAVGPDGNLYVADGGNHRIRKVTRDGEVSTVAGGAQGNVNGPLGTATFAVPSDLCFGADGALYVADGINHNLRKLDLKLGVVTTLAGSGNPGLVNGKGASARFNAPTGLSVDGKGNILVADSQNHAIRLVTPDGVVSMLAGGVKGFADGSESELKFDGPTDVALGAAGAIFVSDTNNHRVRRLN